MKKWLFLFLIVGLTGLNVNAQQLPEHSPSRDDTFIMVEQMPKFPGGEEALFDYIKINLQYPDFGKEERAEGKVMVSFVVDKKGKVIDVKAKNHINAKLEKEAVRVVKGMPNWEAGVQDGKPVNVQMMLPINFKAN